MNKKMTLIKSLSFVITLFCAVNFGFGQSIFTNPITGSNIQPTVSNPYTTGQTVNGNITVSGIGKGLGVNGVATTNRYNANSWNSAALDNTAYFTFTLTPKSGYQINFASFVYSGLVAGGGPTNFAFRSSLDGYTSNIGTPTSTGTTINLSAAAYQNIATSITFRIYGFGASQNSGTFSINDFIFNGTVTALPPCPTFTTWNGTTWTSGVPNLGVNAVIAADYNTGSSSIGSFSACSLTVNPGVTLTIGDVDNGALSNTYVVAQNDLTVNGTILMNPKGNFVQLDDSGTVTGSGTCEVEKNTAPMNDWYEYTYWSSPVFEPQISDALSFSDASRRFKFNGQNYLDAFAETNNNGAALAGQDGIDDNGDDWQWVNGTTKMLRGVGYAATHDEAGFISFGPLPWSFKYVFNGLFNTGEVPVPIYRNDSEPNDDNWNFIGNPYPSAIDADLFLAANTDVATDVVSPKSFDGAIFLWSQNTAPSGTENGNEVLNFSTADYAIINGIGQVAGGDGIIPSRKIPSGQGFFVSMTNSGGTLLGGDIWTTDVIFNNSMRVRGASDNSQFFKDSNTKDKSSSSNTNKLWVNLTSDNGVFNQTLVGYAEGASNNNDGAYYDAVKNLSAGWAAILYSTIEGTNKVFAIQGKAPSSLNENEVINLGFNTNIDVATIYTLSIPQLEGDFLSTNKVYLKDNLLNTLHDLSGSDYNFTSEVGEFKDRFEIVFNAQALSAYTFNLDANTVQIIQVDDTHVTFKASSNLNIKSVAIYDLLGRQLYQLEGSHNEETYNLSNLNHYVFIAKIELSNGALITKKAIKK